MKYVVCIIRFFFFSLAIARVSDTKWYDDTVTKSSVTMLLLSNGDERQWKYNEKYITCACMCVCRQSSSIGWILIGKIAAFERTRLPSFWKEKKKTRDEFGEYRMYPIATNCSSEYVYSHQLNPLFYLRWVTARLEWSRIVSSWAALLRLTALSSVFNAVGTRVINESCTAALLRSGVRFGLDSRDKFSPMAKTASQVRPRFRCEISFLVFTYTRTGYVALKVLV